MVVYREKCPEIKRELANPMKSPSQTVEEGHLIKDSQGNTKKAAIANHYPDQERTEGIVVFFDQHNKRVRREVAFVHDILSPLEALSSRKG